MSKTVSRDKYEKLKSTAHKWMEECEILKNKLESIPEIEDIIQLEKENKTLKDVINNDIFENELLSSLKSENKEISEELQTYKRNVFLNYEIPKHIEMRKI